MDYSYNGTDKGQQDETGLQTNVERSECVRTVTANPDGVGIFAI